MSKLIETNATLLVDSNWDKAKKIEIYRFWDESHTIPSPIKGVSQAEIFLEGRWQRMFFNRVWGTRFDPDKQGTWLKQKKSRHFSVATGCCCYRVRYWVDG
jgi:hypothetical protein